MILLNPFPLKKCKEVIKRKDERKVKRKVDETRGTSNGHSGHGVPNCLSFFFMAVWTSPHPLILGRCAYLGEFLLPFQESRTHQWG